MFDRFNIMNKYRKKLNTKQTKLFFGVENHYGKLQDKLYMKQKCFYFFQITD